MTEDVNLSIQLKHVLLQKIMIEKRNNMAIKITLNIVLLFNP